MTKQNKNSGFSIVELLLMLIVATVLGLTGWYVYHARQVSDEDYAAAAHTTTPTFKKKTTTPETAIKSSSSATPSQQSEAAPIPFRVVGVAMPGPKLNAWQTCSGDPISCAPAYSCVLSGYVTLNQPITTWDFNNPADVPTVTYDVSETDTKTGQITYSSKATTEQLTNDPGPVKNSYMLQDVNAWLSTDLNNPDTRYWQINVTSPNRVSGQTIDTNVCYKQGY